MDAALAKEARFAIIRYLVDQLEDVGKTKIQKIVYFLQNVSSVPLDYVYTMYYFGPYSEELNDDLLDMKLQDYLHIEPAPDGYGYHVRPGKENLASMEDKTEPYTELLDDCLGRFGGFASLQLELLATLYFVAHSEDRLTREEIVTKVKMLKPKFDTPAIEDFYGKLEDLVGVSK
jgi:uncharacterized protein YwgA